MIIRLLAVGGKQPEWIQSGYQDYARRLPPECRLELVSIALGRRDRGGDPRAAIAEEGRKQSAALRPGARVVAMDERGRGWTTRELAARLQSWLDEGRGVDLLVGGPDGLHPDCRSSAEEVWSLSPLTLPHGMVRILVAEQLYRAWSLLRGHPYHRD